MSDDQPTDPRPRLLTFPTQPGENVVNKMRSLLPELSLALIADHRVDLHNSNVLATNLRQALLTLAEHGIQVQNLTHNVAEVDRIQAISTRRQIELDLNQRLINVLHDHPSDAADQLRVLANEMESHYGGPDKK